jgi:hypothetical protein
MMAELVARHPRSSRRPLEGRPSSGTEQPIEVARWGQVKMQAWIGACQRCEPGPKPVGVNREAQHQSEASDTFTVAGFAAASCPPGQRLLRGLDRGGTTKIYQQAPPDANIDLGRCPSPIVKDNALEAICLLEASFQS